MKPSTKITIGILTAVILLAFIPTYDLVLKDRIDSVEVVVVKPGVKIKPTELISKDKLTTEPRRKQDLVEDVVFAKDINDITGYDAAELLVGNAMVSKQMVDFDEMIPDVDEGEAIRPIPNDWIYAQPGSLRRKDNIDIYVVPNKFTKEEAEGDSPNNVVSSVDEAIKEPSEELKKDLGLKAPILTDVKVFYAKDANNNEVQHPEGKVQEINERLNATAKISDLELLLAEEDFQLLMEHVINKGDQIYITYN